MEVSPASMLSFTAVGIQGVVLVVLALSYVFNSRMKTGAQRAPLLLAAEEMSSSTSQVEQRRSRKSQHKRKGQIMVAQPASDVEAAAADVLQMQEDIEGAGSYDQVRSCTQHLGAKAVAIQDADDRVYSSGLLLAHRSVSLRVARGPPGLELDPAMAVGAAARASASLRAMVMVQHSH
jgi:hypothetical protein